MPIEPLLPLPLPLFLLLLLSLPLGASAAELGRAEQAVKHCEHVSHSQYALLERYGAATACRRVD